MLNRGTMDKYSVGQVEIGQGLALNSGYGNVNSIS
jgi:hypothetical protein